MGSENDNIYKENGGGFFFFFFSSFIFSSIPAKTKAKAEADGFEVSSFYLFLIFILFEKKRSFERHVTKGMSGRGGGE